MLTLGFLNTYFAKLALVHSAKKGKSSTEIAGVLKVSPYFVRDYVAHAQNYSLGKVVEVQRHLRQFDLRSKGLGGDGSDQGELLRELVAKVMA